MVTQDDLREHTPVLPNDVEVAQKMVPHYMEFANGLKSLADKVEVGVREAAADTQTWLDLNQKLTEGQQVIDEIARRYKLHTAQPAEDSLRQGCLDDLKKAITMLNEQQVLAVQSYRRMLEVRKKEDDDPHIPEYQHLADTVIQNATTSDG